MDFSDIIQTADYTVNVWTYVTRLTASITMKSAANHGDAHCTYYARIPGLMCTIIEHRMTQAPIVPDNILIWCSSTLIPRHQLPPMTHLGTMLHFQLPMPSIITRPPAATAADEGRRPPARERWPFPRNIAWVERTHGGLASNPSLTVAHTISWVTRRASMARRVFALSSLTFYNRILCRVIMVFHPPSRDFQVSTQ